MGYNVAIDGPAGAGKSTIAKLVAKEKGIYLRRYRSDVPGNGGLFSAGGDFPAGYRKNPSCGTKCGCEHLL